jgi:hypothetical protein
MNSIIRKIQSQKGGTFILSTVEDAELCNPIELFERASVRMLVILYLDMIEKMGFGKKELAYE